MTPDVQITVVIFGGTVQHSKTKSHFASNCPCSKSGIIHFVHFVNFFPFHYVCEFILISRNHVSILNPISLCRHLGSSVKAEGIGWVIQNILLRGLSMSTSARTRKMENYACEGRSQEKLWWRFIAILTCKSFVILGYRGKRTKVLDESFRILC